jgi:hypothetical protein
MDGITDRGTNTLASRGLEEPAHASHGLEEQFFQLCCCDSLCFWWELGFGCTYYYVLGVPYSCFLLWRESFITTGKKSSSPMSGGLCCCVSFWFWREIGFGCTYFYVLGVPYSCFLLWRESFITTGKKSSSRLSGGLCCCVSFWFWQEIGFGCTYYYVLGVPYIGGVVLVFLVLAGNSFWCYVRT